MSLSAIERREKIIYALVSGGEANISELSRATGVSRAVVTREVYLLLDKGYLILKGNRFALSPKRCIALLSLHREYAKLSAVNAGGIFYSEEIEYLETFSFNDNASLAGRRLLDYAEYLRGEGYIAIGAVIHDGKKLPYAPTLTNIECKARSADVLASTLKEKFGECSVLCLDFERLKSLLCSNGKTICEGSENTAITLTNAAIASLGLLHPDIVAVIGNANCQEEFNEQLQAACRSRRIEFLHFAHCEEAEMLIKAIISQIASDS